MRYLTLLIAFFILSRCVTYNYVEMRGTPTYQCILIEKSMDGVEPIEEVPCNVLLYAEQEHTTIQLYCVPCTYEVGKYYKQTFNQTNNETITHPLSN